jgi:hypothetical protein
MKDLASLPSHVIVCYQPVKLLFTVCLVRMSDSAGQLGVEVFGMISNAFASRTIHCIIHRFTCDRLHLQYFDRRD